MLETTIRSIVFQDDPRKRKEEKNCCFVVKSFVVSYSLNNLHAAPSLGALLYTLSLNAHERQEKWKPKKGEKERKKEKKRRRESEGAVPGVPQIKWSPDQGMAFRKI